MKYHALFVIFEKAAKCETVVCCKLLVAFYGLLQYLIGYLNFVYDMDLILLHANKNGADQSAHWCSLISPYVNSFWRV